MNEYLIGFRSGKQLTVNVSDGKDLVKNIVDCINKHPSVQVNWYCEPGLMLNVSEINYVVPRAATIGWDRE